MTIDYFDPLTNIMKCDIMILRSLTTVLASQKAKNHKNGKYGGYMKLFKETGGLRIGSSNLMGSSNSFGMTIQQEKELHASIRAKMQQEKASDSEK